MRALKDSHASVKQKLRAKYFKTGGNQPGVVLTRTAGPQRREDSKGRSGLAKKTQVAVSSRDRKDPA